MFSFLKRKKRIMDLNLKPIQDIKRRARILVIDDDENSFPLDILKREGYAIDYWKKVESLGKLEDGFYDIIILDIGGIATEFTAEDGLGIIEHVKQVNPNQVVVAFSGQSFDLSKNKFWKMADDSLSKPVDATKCKRLIDGLLTEKITAKHYSEALFEILKREGVPDKKIAEIEDKIAKALGNKDQKGIEDILRSVTSKGDVILRLTNLAIKLIDFFN